MTSTSDFPSYRYLDASELADLLGLSLRTITLRAKRRLWLLFVVVCQRIRLVVCNDARKQCGLQPCPARRRTHGWQGWGSPSVGRSPRGSQVPLAGAVTSACPCAAAMTRWYSVAAAGRRVTASVRDGVSRLS
jgi:hypothetical protein